jgi:hypothetical protein
MPTDETIMSFQPAPQRPVRPLIPHSQRRGALLVLVALSMVGLMGMLVLALDVGMLHRKKRIAQMAADAAAKAGAIEIYRERTDSVFASPRSEASRNGFTHGVGLREVIVTWPSPGPSPYSGQYFVKVEVRDTATSIFARLVGRSTVPVIATAWGGVTGGAQTCILALDPDAQDALIVQSGGHVVANNCNVAVNSSSTQAMCVTASEGGSLVASEISITGQYDDGCSGTVTGTVSEGQTAAADQLASVTPTLADTLSNSLASCLGGVYDPNLSKFDASTTLNPSVGVNGTNKAFCGGISIAKAGATLTLNPGIYVIRGGGFNVSSCANVVGNGVVIVNLNPPPPTKVNNFDVIDIAGCGTVNLTAMTTGTFAGIVFYTPRGQGGAPGVVQLNNIHSSASATIGGSMYFPDQELHIGSGNSGVCPNTCLSITGGITAGVINFAADSYVNVSGSPGGTPGGVRRASLVR